jgi:cell division protein FtsL
LPRISASRIIFLLTVVIVAYFLVTGAFNAIRSHNLRQEQGRLQADIEGLQGRYQRLQALKEYLNSDEYIESVAREQLGLVRQGETGFVAISTVPSPTPAPDEADRGLWWDVLIR